MPFCSSEGLRHYHYSQNRRGQRLVWLVIRQKKIYIEDYNFVMSKVKWKC